MSDINMDWLKNNLPEHPVLFDIGAANLNDSFQFRQNFPTAKIFAFECADSWKEINFNNAPKAGIVYFHMAISDEDGYTTFYPSVQLGNNPWAWSGSTCKPTENLREDLKMGQGVNVRSMKLNSFCKEKGIYPDFVHIDAQGAEYKIFKAIKEDLTVRPKFVWAEVTEFENYDSQTTYDGFNLLMEELGYVKIYKAECDELFALKDSKYTEYK